MIKKNNIILLLSFLVLTSWLTHPSLAQTAQDSNTALEETVENKTDITGFRSAHFGMTKRQVLLAIEKDFNVKPADLIQGRNVVEKVLSFSFHHDQPLPNINQPGFITYHCNFRRNKLVKIDLLWDTQRDPALTQETLNQIKSDVIKELNIALDSSTLPLETIDDEQDKITLSEEKRKDGHASLTITYSMFFPSDG